MKKTDSEKLGQIATMLGDVVESFGKRFDETDRKLEVITSELAGVKNTMATASELAIVRRDVEELKEKVESHNGFAKEIDHTMQRVVEIEKHLGIQHKIAA